jgi:uncharacterized membrane protein
MKTETTWSPIKRIGFRFFFIYVFLYAFPFPLDAISYLQELSSDVGSFLWKFLVPFIGDSFFDIEIDGKRPVTGSGDMTYDYLQLLAVFLLSFLGALIWSIIDRHRKSYVKLLRFLIIYMAYYVMFSMLSYGFYKVFPLQFPAPSLGRLIQPYGNSSPMGIAWTFMGASKVYTIFSGFAEIVGGVLLMFRRTRTLGGLVVFGVMLNVFMMNMCYDIPVKLYSFHLMFFGTFIFLQDWKRVFAVFITKASTTARSFPAYFSKDFTLKSKQTKTATDADEQVSESSEGKPLYIPSKYLNIGALALKILILGHFFYTTVGQALEANASYGPNVPKPPMYGIYEITHFEKNKDTIPLLITNDTLWRRIVFQRKNYFSIYYMNNGGIWLSMELDTIAKTMELKNRRDSTDVYSLKYTLKDSILSLKGTHKTDSLHIKAKQYDLKKFRLISRGFNWINERPYNR